MEENVEGVRIQGYLYKQGSKIGAWQKRFFLLHGSLISYYQEEEEAQEPDEAKVRWAGMVTEARAEGWAAPVAQMAAPAGARKAAAALTLVSDVLGELWL